MIQKTDREALLKDLENYGNKTAILRLHKTQCEIIDYLNEQSEENIKVLDILEQNLK